MKIIFVFKAVFKYSIKKSIRISASSVYRAFEVSCNNSIIFSFYFICVGKHFFSFFSKNCYWKANKLIISSKQIDMFRLKIKHLFFNILVFLPFCDNSLIYVFSKIFNRTYWKRYLITINEHLDIIYRKTSRLVPGSDHNTLWDKIRVLFAIRCWPKNSFFEPLNNSTELTKQ